jgi:3-oxoacyl-[acyl-carrier-protein] synthase II
MLVNMEEDWDRVFPFKMKRRVVVSGMGMVTPGGIGLGPNWQRLVEGKSMASSTTSPDFPLSITVQVRDFRVEEYIKDRRILRFLPQEEGYCIAAAKMAVEDAELEAGKVDLGEGGLYLGSSKEITWPDWVFPAIIESMDGNGLVDNKRFSSQAVHKINPLHSLQHYLPNTCLCYISQMFKLHGVNNNFITFDVASSQAIGEAFYAIQRGDSDLILAGGYDSTLNRMSASCLGELGLLSHSHDPERACRPFDRLRDGTILGEGAGMVVLEELSQALARKARIYAEIVGFSSTTNPEIPIPHRKSLSLAIEKSLSEEGTSPSEVGYINLQGNATPQGDIIETQALKDALGRRAYDIPLSSTKPITGYLRAASGVVEFIYTILTLSHGVLPPTVNYQYPDPECDLDYIPGQPRRADIDVAISINYGGGRNAILVVRRF